MTHNTELAGNLLTYSEERSRMLSKSLSDMRKRSPAVPLNGASGTLERVLGEFNRLHESESVQIHSRSSALDIRVRQQVRTKSILFHLFLGFTFH